MDEPLNPSHQKLFRIGVLGIPPDWQERFVPALTSLAERVQVVAIYDAVGETAEREAAALGAVSVNGAIATARRSDVDGLLVLDTGWHRQHLLPVIAECRKPIFLRSRLPNQESLANLQSTVTAARTLCVPSLAHRFQPATIRVMELIASQLGSPLRLDILVKENAEEWQTRRLAEIVDWMFFVVRTSTELHSIRIDQGGCRLRFRMPADRASIDAFIRIAREDEQPSYSARCQRGRVTMLSDTDLHWQITGQRDEVVESLQSDRTATEMELGIFCRRAAGGLVPAADLSDLHRARAIAEQIAAAWF